MREFDCVDCGAVNNPAENTHCYNCGMPRPVACPHCRLNNSAGNTHCYSCGNVMHHVHQTVTTYVQPVVVVQDYNHYGHHGHHGHHGLDVDVAIDLDGDGDIDIIID